MRYRAHVWGHEGYIHAALEVDMGSGKLEHVALGAAKWKTSEAANAAVAAKLAALAAAAAAAAAAAGSRA